MLSFFPWETLLKHLFSWQANAPQTHPSRSFNGQTALHRRSFNASSTVAHRQPRHLFHAPAAPPAHRRTHHEGRAHSTDTSQASRRRCGAAPRRRGVGGDASVAELIVRRFRDVVLDTSKQNSRTPAVFPLPIIFCLPSYDITVISVRTHRRKK